MKPILKVGDVSSKARLSLSELPCISEIDQALNSNLTAVTRAAVNAILARKSFRSEGTRSFPLVDVTAPSPSPSIAPVTSSSSDNQPIPLNNISTTVEQPSTAPRCPVCDKRPSHVRSRCPIIKAGVRSMRQRIAELQRDTPEGNDEEREKVIEELQRIIDKRTKRIQTPTTANVKSIADKPVILPALPADSSPVLEPPKTSQAVKPKAPSQEIKSTPLPHFAEALSFGDVSSYTEQDLEALIRGPNVTLADVPSSDSSEEEEVLEEESEEVQFEPSRSQGRVQYPSSSEEEEEEEEEEEASPFVPSIIPLPIRSASERSSEDELSRPEDLQGDTSFHEVNDLGSSMEVDKTGDTAVNDAYAQDFAHLSAPEPSGNGRKVVGDLLSTLDEKQVSDESEPKMASDATIATPQPTPQSDPIEAFEQPKSSSPQSSIVSIEEDIHPLQSTPKAEVAVRAKSQRISSILARKTTNLTSKPHSVTSRTGVNGISKSSKLTKKTESLTRVTDLPIPVNPAVRVIKPVGVQTRRQAARAEEEEEEEEEQGPTDASQAKQKKAQLSDSKTSPNATKTPAEIAKTSTKTPAKIPAKIPVRSNGENPEIRSVTVVQNVPTIQSAPSKAKRSLASWAVLEGNSQAESEMVDELRYSPDTPAFPTPAQRPAVVNGVSKEPDPLFLHSESQQSFPYSQYPNLPQEPPGSEDEEDEVQASVVKPQTTTKSSSKFRSLTEIASQPSLFTTMRLPQTNSTKEEVMNLYGRANKAEEEESSDSDTESESDAGAKAQTSHIPWSRRAGI
jgi:hypothetical protein